MFYTVSGNESHSVSKSIGFINCRAASSSAAPGCTIH